MNDGRVIVVGAGLAGLSAAVALARQGRAVILVEAANQAGGRCRSYFDSTLGQVIDNGNHLVLSGNHATFAFLKTIGGEAGLTGPGHAQFAFMDVRDRSRWTVRPNEGPLPWWVFAKDRRVRGTGVTDYLSIARLLLASGDARIGDVIACKGALWERLLHPFLLAALNTEPQQASARLAGAVIRETLAKGGRFYHPRIAHPALAAAFIDPALAYLEKHHATVHLGQRARAVTFADNRATALNFAGMEIALGQSDTLILAVPPWIATELLPGIAAPDEFRAILNAHFRTAPKAGAASMTGVIGGTAEWIFAFPDRISVTLSGADWLIDEDRETLAQRLWADVARVHDLPTTLPPWQIVKEKRATFAATPQQDAKRPAAATQWKNVFLAGDWTATGLPATIEGAVRSGVRAAELALASAPR